MKKDKRGFEVIDKRFESMEKRFDQMITIIMGIIMAFAGIVAVTISFAIWDRQTALAPAIKVNRKIEERERKVERALIEFVKDEPRLAVALRYADVW